MSDSPRNQPFDLLGWIEQNRSAFEPPVANKVVWQDADQIFMIIRGPNARSDFHIDPYDEIFFQLRGTIRVDLILDGERVERLVPEGSVMLVPAGVPHAPLRPADTWGLVVERPRGADDLDQLVWFCDVCGEEVGRVEFHMANIEVELKQALDAYNGDEARRTCPNGHVNPIPTNFQL